MAVRLTSPQGVWDLPSGTFLLGRDPACALRLDDPRVSRRHARVTVAGSNVLIEDMGSSNGVLVNGDIVGAGRQLKSGDLVVVGPYVFAIRIDAQGSDPLPAPAGTIKPIAGLQGENDLIPNTDRHLRRTLGMAPDAHAPSAKASLTPSPDEAPQPSKAGVARPASQASEALTAHVDRAGPHPQAQRVETTDRLLPSQSSASVTQALLPNDDQARFHRHLIRIRVRRLFAGILDPLQTVLLAAVTALPAFLLGLSGALRLAGAGIDVDGLPSLVTGVGGASFGDLLLSLGRPASLARTGELLEHLRAVSRQGFLLFFAAGTVAAITAVLIFLYTLVAPTVLKGGPFWHRQFRLVIRERSTGYFPTAGYALLRWCLAAALAPLALIAVVLGRRSPHDLLAGCLLRGTEDLDAG